MYLEWQISAKINNKVEPNKNTNNFFSNITRRFLKVRNRLMQNGNLFKNNLMVLK